MSAAGTYDPIPDLALLLAMRSRQDNGVDPHADRNVVRTLIERIGLDPDNFPYTEEIEAELRGLIAAKGASQ